VFAESGTAQEHSPHLHHEVLAQYMGDSMECRCHSISIPAQEWTIVLGEGECKGLPRLTLAIETTYGCMGGSERTIEERENSTGQWLATA
jgi:hypothetical protein